MVSVLSELAIDPARTTERSERMTNYQKLLSGMDVDNFNRLVLMVDFNCVNCCVCPYQGCPRRDESATKMPPLSECAELLTEWLNQEVSE